jgi:hypothetical protein
MNTPSFVTHHYMPRGGEILIGTILAVIGLWLIWLAFDGRGRKMWWPLSGLMPI